MIKDKNTSVEQMDKTVVTHKTIESKITKKYSCPNLQNTKL